MASGVAAAGAAVAFYFYSRKVHVCGFGGDNKQDTQSGSEQHFEGAYQAPSTWIEALHFFAEALRYMYHESLGRWRSSDLLIGLAYLAQQESAAHAASDIAKKGVLAGAGQPVQKRLQLAREFRCVAHLMKFCQSLRERHVPTQSLLLSKLGIKAEDVLMQQGFAGMLKPSFVMVRDHRTRSIVLAIRGTHSIKDMFTSLTSATKPHHMVHGAKVILGYSHFGMLAAARWVLQETLTKLEEALQSCPTYSLKIVGHSLGGGTAALLTARLREMGGLFANATCLAVACPACMTKELAQACSSYTTTIVNGHDMIPTLSPGAADMLREAVMQSSWYEAFRADLRSSIVVRAVETSLGSVGTMTGLASSWTSSRLSLAKQSFRTCYAGPADTATTNDSSANTESLLGNVQVAKDWAEPEEETSESLWGDVLKRLGPIHPSGKQRELEVEGNAHQRWSGRPDSLEAGPSERQGVDVGASCIPPGSTPISPSFTSPPSTKPGSVWSRLWPACRPSPPPLSQLNIDEANQDSNFDSLQPPDTPSMQMERALSEEDDDLWFGGRMELSPSAHQRMGRSAAAVWGLPEGKGVSESETEDISQPPSASSRQDRRMTFPAGKIYHLLPAYLVFGEEEAARKRTCRLESVSCSAPEQSLSETSATVEAIDRPEQENTCDCKSGDADSFRDVFREGVDGNATAAPGEDPLVVIARAKGSIGLPPPVPSVHDSVLLQDIPQELYGRIRLCKRMLADHFVPVYLGALEVALQYVEHDYFNDTAIAAAAADSSESGLQPPIPANSLPEMQVRLDSET